MKRNSKRRYIFGGAVVLTVAALIFAVFSLLSMTEKTDLSLGDLQDRRFGWRYEVLTDEGARPYEPVFEVWYFQLPEDTRAVRLTRTMTEDIPQAELMWMSYQDGVEVALDGLTLYTDFPGLPRDADGFVHPDEAQWERIWREQSDTVRTTRMTLPSDYLGRELSVTTYFREGYGLWPEYPSIGGQDAMLPTSTLVTAVRYNAVMTVYALLALLMTGMFLVDVYNGVGDGKTLLLSLYFLLLFLKEAYGSIAGYYSVLTARLDLRFLSAVYMAPLYLYLALRMKGRWKWPLCTAVGIWAVFESVRELLLPEGLAGLVGPETLAVMLAVTAALAADGLRRKRTGREKKRLLIYGLIAAALTAVYMLNRVRAWDGDFAGYFRDELWLCLRTGNCWPVVSQMTGVISWMTVIAVVSEGVRRTLATRRTVDILWERQRQTVAGYERMLASEDDTRALHHEMRHHMLALSAILADGDTARARRYVDAVAEDLSQVPTGRYCKNILVDMIAGSFLDRAAAQGIRVEQHLNVPETLNIADEDLSVFLSNMLQNALEACKRMAPERERYIWVDMHLRGNFLCVQCVNSCPDGEEPRRREGHGYGLAAMRAVAENTTAPCS